MIRQEELAHVIDSQQISFSKKDLGFSREILFKVPIVKSFATIITGLRRCGKSTLLLQILKGKQSDLGGDILILNFEDVRLSNFGKEDFARLYDEIIRRNSKILYFDEIQLTDGWEIFVNHLLRENFQVFITGSNASMLSIELGTHLTGRHLSVELFPFSYSEFVRFKGFDFGEESLKLYLENGGIPEFVSLNIPSIVSLLVDDILVRDIAVRYAVRDVAALKQLTLFLISNIGNPISANKLIGMYGINSATTFLEYFSYLKDSYILDFVPLYHDSLKVQARNPKKVYVADTGIYTELAVSASRNDGRMLENLVFNHLRRNSKSIFYFKGKGECDFVVMEKSRISKVVQVCFQINNENFDRELNGIREAMMQLKVDKGFIVTMNQSDIFRTDFGVIQMMPAYEFLMMELSLV